MLSFGLKLSRLLTQRPALRLAGNTALSCPPHPTPAPSGQPGSPGHSTVPSVPPAQGKSEPQVPTLISCRFRAIIWRKEEGNEKYFSHQIKLRTEPRSISQALSQERPNFIPPYVFCDTVSCAHALCQGFACRCGPTPCRGGEPCTPTHSLQKLQIRSTVGWLPFYEPTVSSPRLRSAHPVLCAHQEQTRKGDTIQGQGRERSR